MTRGRGQGRGSAAEGAPAGGQGGHETEVSDPLASQVNLGLLGLGLLLQLLGLDLLLLAVVVGEVVHHDGDGERHHQHAAHRRDRAHDLAKDGVWVKK